MPSHYLLKSEPHPRLERGIDISYPFSRLLTSPSRSTSWEGVRNPVAGKILRGMCVGDTALWYHSNCPLPSIVGTVRVCLAPRPDHTAFDESHPYFDKKSKKEEPRWFMPDVEYEAELKHQVPLALLQHIATAGFEQGEQRRDVPYLTDGHIRAIRGMDLLRLGRLSVQRVEDEAWEAVLLLGERGGWQGKWKGKWEGKGAGKAKGGKRKREEEEGQGGEADDKGGKKATKKAATAATATTAAKDKGKKAAAPPPPPPQREGLRRSTRTRR